MSLLQIIDGIIWMAEARHMPAVGMCVEREHSGSDDLVRFIPELIRRGHPVESPGFHISYPLFYAFKYGCMKSLATLLELIPRPGLCRDEMDNTIVHAAAVSERKDLVDLALSLCPEGLNYTNLNGQTPLMYGALQHLNPATRELIHRGCDMNTPCDFSPHRIGAPRQILDFLSFHGRENDSLWKYCIAFGAIPNCFFYRAYEGSDSDHPEYVLDTRGIDTRYLDTINAVDNCRSAACAILRLVRARGNVCGNGRDALRLIAEEVWLSRLDESWEK